MSKLQQQLIRLIHSDKGQDMVEYALIAGFISVAAGAVLPGFSDGISTIFSRCGSYLVLAAA